MLPARIISGRQIWRFSVAFWHQAPEPLNPLGSRFSFAGGNSIRIFFFGLNPSGRFFRAQSAQGIKVEGGRGENHRRRNEVAEAPRSITEASESVEEADAMLVERRVPLFRGKWRMLPPEVEGSARK